MWLTTDEWNEAMDEFFSNESDLDDWEIELLNEEN